jgi:AraC-like DNA-binding protein
MSPHQTAVAPRVFSTRGLAPKVQLDAWRAWHRSVVDVAPLQDERMEGFAAESRLWLLDGMAIGRVSAPALQTIRTSTHIRRDPTDHWVLTVGFGATTKVASNGDAYSVPIRVPFVTSLAETCESVRARDDRLHLYIARDRFVALSRVLDRVRGPLAGPLGLLLTDYLELLERSLPHLSEADLLKLPGAISAMLASCTGASSLQEGSASAQIGRTVRERIRQVVRSQLRSPSLGPASICRAVGISRSGLYRLMQDEGGVARYIQSQRLRACYALCDPENTQTINAIADAHGFPDSSSFNRAFRRKFSLAPGDVRAAAQAEATWMTARNVTSASDLVSMRDCLRSL